VLLVGLTGGIGSGKSTVAGLLAEHGAVVLDADGIVRDLQRRGTSVFARIVDRFGEEMVTSEGELDRALLAGIVFADADARNDLNAIVHPEVWRVIQDELARLRDSHRIVVMDVPLLAEAGGAMGLDLVVTVEAAEVARIERLEARGLGEEDARARMEAQASTEQRRAIADVVVANDGSLDDLRAEVDRLWAMLIDLEQPDGR